MLHRDKVVHPRVELSLLFNNHVGLHSIVACAAKLRTDYLELASADWLEPHRNAHPRDCILIMPHVLESKAMNDVFRCDVDDRGLMVNYVQLVLRNDVILASGILWIQAERV